MSPRRQTFDRVSESEAHTHLAGRSDLRAPARSAGSGPEGSGCPAGRPLQRQRTAGRPCSPGFRRQAAQATLRGWRITGAAEVCKRTGWNASALPAAMFSRVSMADRMLSPTQRTARIDTGQSSALRGALHFARLIGFSTSEKDRIDNANAPSTRSTFVPAERSCPAYSAPIPRARANAAQVKRVRPVAYVAERSQSEQASGTEARVHVANTRRDHERRRDRGEQCCIPGERRRSREGHSGGHDAGEADPTGYRANSGALRAQDWSP